LICLTLGSLLPLASPASAQEGIVTPNSLGSGVFAEGFSLPNVSVEPSTGAATSVIPFLLIPARGAAQPSLTLTYSSEAGVRSAGVGWGLALPSIERRNLSGPPSYNNNPVTGDRFIFMGQPIIPICVVTQDGHCSDTNGKQIAELMPSWAGNWTYYRAQVESSFNRIFWSQDRNTWRVQLKNGVTLELGTPLVLPGLAGPAADVDGTAKLAPTFRWNLVRQYDTLTSAAPGITAGNSSRLNLVVYSWSPDPLGLGYLTDIYDTPPATATFSVADFAHHVHLAYEPHDFPNYSFVRIWRAVPANRLKGVDVTSQDLAVTGNRALVRRYHLSYKSMVHGSYLQSVQLEGQCPATESAQGNLPDQTNCPTLPPVTLTYSEAPATTGGSITPWWISYASTPNPNNPIKWLGTTSLFDVDRDGLPDVVGTFGGIIPPGAPNAGEADDDLYFNRLATDPQLGLTSHFDYKPVDTYYISLFSSPTHQVINTFLSATQGVSIIGYWGNNSRTSILWQTDPANGGFYYSFHPDPFGIFQSPPGQFNWQWTPGGGYGPPSSSLPAVYLAGDFDGDGLLDAIGVDNNVYFTRQTAPGTAVAGEFVQPFSHSATATPDILIANPTPAPPPLNLLPASSQFADMNGDGVPDYVTMLNPGTPNQQYIYYPGNGKGDFGCKFNSGQGFCVTPGQPCNSASSPGCVGNTWPCPPATGNCQIGYVPIQASGAPPYPDPTLTICSQCQQVYFHDVNGDGLADIILVDNYRFIISIWINDDGVKFHRLQDIGLPPYVAYIRVTFGDMNGSGVDDLVVMFQTGVNPNGPLSGIFYYDLALVDPSNPIRQGLLTSVSNGLGLSTSIEYHSTAYLDSQSRGTNGEWTNHSPAVMYVVTRVETDNNLPSPYNESRVTTYSYQGPIYDDWQRAFLGFRTVSVDRAGDASQDDLVTTTTYFYGKCQPPNNGNCGQTSDDDDWKAVTGTPAVTQKSTIQNPNGEVYPYGLVTPDGSIVGVISVAGNTGAGPAAVPVETSVHTYISQVLFTGMDGRHVQFAYPKQTDTWVYDTTIGPLSEQLVPMVVVERQGSLSVPAPSSWDTVSVALWTAKGRVHLRGEQSLDAYGNVTHMVDDGEIDDNGTAIDQPIVTDVQPGLLAEYWLWQTATITIHPFAPAAGIPVGQPRTYTFQYDGNGNLTDVFFNLIGTVPLDRFHENPNKQIAPAPQNASADNPSLHLGNWSYDIYGNVTQFQGPDNFCETFGYDAPYQELQIVSQIYTAGAAAAGGCQTQTGIMLGTETVYDRGLNVPVRTIASSGSQNLLSYDAFGRINQINRPDPVLGTPETQPSMTAEYPLTPNGPTQSVHVRMRDGSNSYRDAWTYLDGFGHTIVTLRAADPAAGDGGQWVVSGLPKRNKRGSIYQTFQPWFYSGAPQSLPLAVPPQISLTVGYDGLGRVLSASDPLGKVAQYIYHPLQTDSFDAANLAPSGPHSQLFSTLRHDGHARTVESIRRIRSGNNVNAISTKWTYLATAEIARQVISQAGSPDQVVRTLQYDSSGRMVVNVEPNTTDTSLFYPCGHGPVGPPPHCKPVVTVKAWRYAYDDAGHLVGTSDARGCGENLFYDNVGRQIAEDLSPCRSYQPDYTAPNLTNGDGTESFSVYDLPEPGQTQDYGGNRQFLNGQLVAVSDRGAHTRFALDGRGRVTGVARQLVNPGVPAPSLSSRYAPWWFRKARTFDAADRVSQESTGADVPQLFGSVDNLSNIVLQYSARGLVTSITGSYGTLLSGQKYAEHGSLTDSTYGDIAATHAHIDYDVRQNPKAFRISRVAPSLWTQPSGGYQPPAPGAFTLQLVIEDLALKYDSVNNPVTITDSRTAAEWPAGSKPVSRTMTYDDLYRLTNIDYDGPRRRFPNLGPEGDVQVPPFQAEITAGDLSPVPMRNIPNRIASQSFHYDYLGNVVQSDDDQHAFYDRSLATVQYGSAAQYPNRLLAANSPGGDTVTASYDAGGNLEELDVKRQGPCENPQPVTCSQRFNYEWDETGLLSHAVRWDYETSPGPQPTLDSGLRYAYDASGTRTLISKTDAAGNQTYTASVFDSLRLNHTTWNSGTGNYARTPAAESAYLARIGRVVYAPGVPSVNGAQQHVFFIMGDTLGSLAAVVDQATGELVETATYDAFGGAETDYRPARWGSFREDFRYTGKEDDIEVGLSYFGARYYHALLGRWISPDPLAVHGLGSDQNPYAFVRGSPVGLIDPAGLDTYGCDNLSPACSSSGLDIGGLINQLVNIFGGGGSGGGSSTAGGGGYRPPPPPPPTAAPGAGVMEGATPFQPFASESFISQWINSGSGGFLQNDRNLADLQEGFALMSLTAASIATGAYAVDALAPAVSAASATLGQMARSATLASFRYVAPLIGMGALGSSSGGSDAVAEEEEVVEKIVQHHIFPQAPDLKALFEKAGIDIDKWALNLPQSVHDSLHSWGDIARFGGGGWWNESWRQFFADPRFAATPPTVQEIWDQAFEMVVIGELSGYLPTVQYVRRWFVP